MLCSAMSHSVLGSCTFCAPQLHRGAQNGTSLSLKFYARVPYIIYKEADSGMTAVYWTVCHVRGKTGAFVIYGGRRSIHLGIIYGSGQASVLAALSGPFFPKNPSLPLLPCLFSLIYVKQVENFAFALKIPLKSFGGNCGKHYLCTRFRPSAGSGA